jgi:hypothetical protein
MTNSVGQWVRTADRLPGPYQRVLVFRAPSTITFALYAPPAGKDGAHWVDTPLATGLHDADWYTDWCLPEPPQ